LWKVKQLEKRWLDSQIERIFLPAGSVPFVKNGEHVLMFTESPQTYEQIYKHTQSRTFLQLQIQQQVGYNIDYEGKYLKSLHVWCPTKFCVPAVVSTFEFSTRENKINLETWILNFAESIKANQVFIRDWQDYDILEISPVFSKKCVAMPRLVEISSTVICGFVQKT